MFVIFCVHLQDIFASLDDKRMISKHDKHHRNSVQKGTWERFLSNTVCGKIMIENGSKHIAIGISKVQATNSM